MKLFARSLFPTYASEIARYVYLVSRRICKGLGKLQLQEPLVDEAEDGGEGQENRGDIEEAHGTIRRSCRPRT